ncbi:CRISPR-associated helicase Cas3' [Siminovitchia fortis]|uniref:CRISPR-associated helicase Cas3' n=2 Tax=Bacillales TaxID=1385 RepID=UPI00119FBC78|nr:CRISPR-associated helicase Cas3' [Siminovitchia fortis]
MDFIGHIREKDGEIQTVQEHLEGVRRLSQEFGEKIGVKNLAGIAGLLHDLGKNTEEFKNYIEEAVKNPNSPPRKGSVDHSTAGGKLLHKLFHNQNNNDLEKLASEWIAMCIISHHSGLRDFLTPDMSSDYLYRVTEKELTEFDYATAAFFKSQITEKEFDQYFCEAVDEVKQIVSKWKENKLKPITLSMIIKYIFSCLIDADRTDTRMFEENDQNGTSLDSNSFFEKSYNSLMERIALYSRSEDADHPINILRSEMSDQCEKFASRPSGIYTLSIPTGGGKTLASLRYALKHAIQHKKERIIYVVPYTTIIEQNAQEVRDILRDDSNILEHHSNVIEEKEIDNEYYDLNKKKLKLAKDNWDSPIIFTTMVQFLNVFYSRGTRNIRRLHNLSNSIIIFDEVQSVPIKCISLFNEALNFLKVFGNSSIVLCTATQPALDFVENDLKISANAEMVQELKKVTKSFKRVNVIDRTTPQGLDAAELKEFIQVEMDTINSLLVILNTKTAVRMLFQELDSDDAQYKLFHLSTSMCPAHRKDILSDIRKSLTNGERVVCLSTQLIEAGVDISFECVIRSLAGLDSIAQAAGRCNRHGKDDIRNVYIIKSADENLKDLKEISIGADQTKRILQEFQRHPDKFGDDLLSPEAMKLYFKYYFDQIKGELDYPVLELRKNAFDLLNHNQDYYTAFAHKHGFKPPIISRQSFATAEKHFNVIDSPTTSLLVPYNEEANNLISDLNGDLDIKELGEILKKAQQYVVNIYKHELDQLSKDDNIDLLLHGNIFALKETAYREDIGIDLEGEGSWSFEFL